MRLSFLYVPVEDVNPKTSAPSLSLLVAAQVPYGRNREIGLNIATSPVRFSGTQIDAVEAPDITAVIT